MSTEAIEDYLKALFRSAPDSGPVSTSELARTLGVRAASVTGMIKKLSRQGLVTHQKYRGARLTETGRREALRIIRRHRLAELYLVRALDLPLEEVHAIAHKWEHVLNDRVLERMAAALDQPTVDPHGSPIPTADGRIRHRQDLALADLPVDQPAEILEVPDGDPDRLRHLRHLGILPGVPVRILARQPFAGPVTIRIGEKKRSLGPELLREIRVRPSRS